MNVAFQMSDITSDNLKFAKQVGVDHIVGVKTSDVIPEGEPRWTHDSLSRFNDFVASHDVKLEVVPLVDPLGIVPDELVTGPTLLQHNLTVTGFPRSLPVLDPRAIGYACEESV